MLRSVKSLFGSAIVAKDGELGKVQDFLFDDRDWAIRYLVVETGSWLSSRRVLLSPSVADAPDWERSAVPVKLTKEQVRSSPDIDTEKPVSRQHEAAMAWHYGWPAYWALEPLPSLGAPPVAVIETSAGEGEGDPHLRSVKEVATYELSAADGDIGKIDDMIMDDASWLIRYLVVNTGTWFSGQKLMVSARWADSISWRDKQVRLARTREEM